MVIEQVTFAVFALRVAGLPSMPARLCEPCALSDGSGAPVPRYGAAARDDPMDGERHLCGQVFQWEPMAIEARRQFGDSHEGEHGPLAHKRRIISWDRRYTAGGRQPARG